MKENKIVGGCPKHPGNNMIDCPECYLENRAAIIEQNEKAKQLIAAGGCFAIQYWSRTDAERLCPKEHKDFQPLDRMPLISEWLLSAKKSIELIEEGIALLHL